MDHLINIYNKKQELVEKLLSLDNEIVLEDMIKEINVKQKT